MVLKVNIRQEDETDIATLKLPHDTQNDSTVPSTSLTGTEQEMNHFTKYGRRVEHAAKRKRILLGL